MKVRSLLNVFLFLFVFFAFQYFSTLNVSAATIPFIQIGANDDPLTVASSVQMLLLISLITLAPTLVIMVTCFPRIIISLHFLRSAMATQQMPPNQVLVGIAVFLTVFQMSPVFTRIYEEAWVPLSQSQLTQEEAFTNFMAPLRDFMIANVEDEDIALFHDLAGEEPLENREDVSTTVLIPSFMLGEIRKGFYAGFYIYIPFIVVDMVVASILMAMGMMMLPPAMISLPFKILIFLSVDGWTLFIGSIMKGIRP